MKIKPIAVACLALLSSNASAQALIGQYGQQPETVLALSGNKPPLVLFNYQESDALPAIQIKPIRLSRTALEDVMDLLSSQTQIPVSVNATSDLNAISRPYPGTGVIQGTLTQVMESLSNTYGFHYHYDAKTNAISIDFERRFYVEVPPTKDALRMVADHLTALGARSIVGSEATQTVQFIATKPQLPQINQFLDSLRTDLTQIVYEVSIIDVRLSDENKLGINWQNFSADSGTGSSFAFNTTPSSSISSGLAGAVKLGIGKLNVMAMLNFLKTQGTATVSNQPLIPIMSGGSAKINVGEKRTYVSNVVSNVANGATTVTTTGVTTATIDIGTTLEVQGSYRDSSVFTNLKLKTAELLDLKSVTIGGNSVQLPQTAERLFEAPLTRIRPGDTMVIGGIISTRKADKRESPGLPLLSWIPTYKEDSVERSELVVMIRPTIVRFESPKPAPQTSSLEGIELPVLDEQPPLTVVRPAANPVNNK